MGNSRVTSLEEKGMGLVKRLKSIRLDTVAADTLNAIFQNWTALKSNPQLTTILNWASPSPHPCNQSNTFNYPHDNEYEGAWGGVGCTAALNQTNTTGNFYDVFVTTLQ
jgi:hypothetical protein